MFNLQNLNLIKDLNIIRKVNVLRYSILYKSRMYNIYKFIIN